jgi:large subunit ribosomal protein L16
MKIFTHLPMTKKPLEVRMGKGKGNVSKWIAKIKAGTILCEIETFEKNKAIAALKRAQYKIRIPTQIKF